MPLRVPYAVVTVVARTQRQHRQRLLPPLRDEWEDVSGCLVPVQVPHFIQGTQTFGFTQVGYLSEVFKSQGQVLPHWGRSGLKF